MKRKTNRNPLFTRLLYAVIILTVALTLPAYLLSGTDWESFEPGIWGVLLPFLYLAVVLGFVALALGYKGRVVTSEQTDRAVAERYRQFGRRLLPVYLLVLTALILWMIYQLWSTLG